jgi:PKD repeat protein
VISGANQSFYNANQSGVYSVEVTDNSSSCINESNGVNIIANSTNFGIDFTASQTNFNIPPFNTSFTNNTTNPNDYYWIWYFGDGNNSSLISPSHTYSFDGTYSVGVIAENISTGCFDTLVKPDYITATGGSANPCTLSPSIIVDGSNIKCPEDSIMLKSNQISPSISYQWIRDGILLSGKTDSVFYAKQNGMYQLMLTDSICTQFSNPTNIAHYPTIIPVISSNGSIMPCTNDSMELYVNTFFPEYEWSNGDTTSNIWVKTSSDYTVTATDANQCKTTSNIFTVNASLLQTPEICIVGVDSNNNNRIIWERNANALIDSFRIYRESVVAGQYTLIGTKGANETGILIDTASNPEIRAYRYKVTAVDTCGMETPSSPHHKSIHLTINAGLNGSWNLIWDGYHGFNFGTYKIYRGTSPSNINLLTQLPSTSTSYTDLNPPSGNVFYQIEVVKPNGCYPDSIYSKANTNYNSSRSNMADNGNIAPIYLNANFSANTLTGQWPIQVSFTDISSGNPTTWKWNFGDGNSSIERNPKHTYNNTGLYDVKLIACNGNVCDTTIKKDYINVLPNGMIEVGVSLSAKIFPNPNDGSFTLEVHSKRQKDAQLFVYNNIGQLIYSDNFTINNNTLKKLDLSTQAKGVYFVHLSTDNGVVYREKVVVQ